jgi:hypothetical protein
VSIASRYSSSASRYEPLYVHYTQPFHSASRLRVARGQPPLVHMYRGIRKGETTETTGGWRREVDGQGYWRHTTWRQLPLTHSVTVQADARSAAARVTGHELRVFAAGRRCATLSTPYRREEAYTAGGGRARAWGAP